MGTNENLNDMAADMAADFLGEQNAAGGRGAKNDKPAPQVYLRCGLAFKTIDAAGNVQQTEVWLNKGLPIDTMDAAPIKSSDTEAWVNQQTRSNLLRDKLAARGLKLAPGAHGATFTMIGQLQRAKGAAAPVQATDAQTLEAIAAFFLEE